MNKKRLYKQSGALHRRGDLVYAEIHNKVQELFEQYGRYHPRDLAHLIAQAVLERGELEVLWQGFSTDRGSRKPPKRVGVKSES